MVFWPKLNFGAPFCMKHLTTTTTKQDCIVIVLPTLRNLSSIKFTMMLVWISIFNHAKLLLLYIPGCLDNCVLHICHLVRNLHVKSRAPVSLSFEKNI